MIIGTSASIAILRDERKQSPVRERLPMQRSRRVGAVNFVKSAVVTDASRDPIATRRFDDFVKAADISIEPG